MKEKRSKHQTQWAAQFAVASELCKRGYQVALTLGNHPKIDLMAISPKDKKQFLIDVKGLYKENFWGAREQPSQEDLYYVFAFVPDNEANSYFVMTQAQVNPEIKRVIEAARKRALAKGKPDKADRFPGVSWKFVQPYKDKWDVLPC
jgi:hypothetical protein